MSDSSSYDQALAHFLHELARLGIGAPAAITFRPDQYKYVKLRTDPINVSLSADYRNDKILGVEHAARY